MAYNRNLSHARVTVAVPTLTAGPVLLECLHSLEKQTCREFEIAIVDNSGCGLVRRTEGIAAETMIIENQVNVGYGAAINQVFKRTAAPYVAVLNDDATAHPRWIESLLEAMEKHPEAGMGACRVRLAGENRLDSAGMLLCGDGVGKQRGHGEPGEAFDECEEVFYPSGSAALYRRAMLEDIGLFDEDFFLYGEDTDLGLRARWGGWKCVYVPGAKVEHRYSHSSGKATRLKAYYAERNRLFVAVKNFPLSMLLLVPFKVTARYFWHLVHLARGSGAAAEFSRTGDSPLLLAWFVARAHLAMLASLPRLLRQRRRILGAARTTAGEFRQLARRYAISPRQVALQ